VFPSEASVGRSEWRVAWLRRLGALHAGGLVMFERIAYTPWYGPLSEANVLQVLDGGTQSVAKTETSLVLVPSSEFP